jgi:4-hydroxythreonine-4-phosphate dehydrogenase
MKPKLAITMGDPGGIGPEVALRAVCRPSIRRTAEPLLVGDLRHLRRLARRLALPLELVPVEATGSARQAVIAVIDTGRMSGKVSVGKPSREGGRFAGKAIEEAVRLAASGEVEGMVTAPVSKESLALAGYGMVGHTELLARLTGTTDYAMMITRGRLRIVFATTHVPLRQVAHELTRPMLLNKIELAREYLDLYMGIPCARIGVTCLNPHCGEGGRLGEEERRIIEPAVRLASRRGIHVGGPYPADSIYRSPVDRRFDVIVAMYHDQGIIPLRLRGHDNVVNITLGIPHVRTSPGHGTAFDIAGKSPASENSMLKAIAECARIAKRLRNARRVQSRR